MSDPTGGLLSAVRAGLAPVLEQAGFVLSANDDRRFSRWPSGRGEVTGLEAQRDGNGGWALALSLGAFFPDLSGVSMWAIASQLVHCRETIGPPGEDGTDRRWRPGEGGPDRLAAEMGRAWTAIAPAWFAARTSPTAAASADLAAGDFLRAAMFRLALGDRAGAQEAVSAGLPAHAASGEDAPLDEIRILAWNHGLDLGAHDSERRWHHHGPHWWGEEAWHLSEGPHHLLAVLERLGVSDKRKFRLGAAGMARQVWGRLPNAARDLVEAAEGYADHRTTYRDLRQAVAGLRDTPPERARLVRSVAHREARHAIGAVPSDLLGGAWSGPLVPDNFGNDLTSLSRRLAAVVRDVFGNPFRAALDLGPWRSATALGLARSIYDERAFDRLPILGDALEEAGCPDRTILDHCRGPGPHVRGCWVVDRLLGKE
jgi:hypothetical protein